MAKQPSKTRGLGRGLSALMADVEPVESVPTNQAVSENVIPIELVAPNPDQPRKSFDPDDLDDLASSIREKGVIQPLIVRKKKTGNADYQIVAGERRWRAAQKANLHQIPVIVKEFDDIEVLEVAIIENIQRSDLNPVDEALGYQQLMEKFGHTQDKLAQSLSKSRSYIANSMRLLKLPSEVLTLLEGGKLSTGHARALITADDPVGIAKQIVAKDLSVRDTEKLVKRPAAKTAKTPAPRAEKDADTKALEHELSAALKMKVSIDHNEKAQKGTVTLRYNSLEQLDDFLQAIGAL